MAEAMRMDVVYAGPPADPSEHLGQLGARHRPVQSTYEERIRGLGVLARGQVPPDHLAGPWAEWESPLLHPLAFAHEDPVVAIVYILDLQIAQLTGAHTGI